MSQTVFVGPQLLHSEENNINANLSILIITVLDNIVTKKQGAALPCPCQPGLSPPPTTARRPLWHPSWRPHFGQVAHWLLDLIISKCIVVLIIWTSQHKPSQYQLHDHHQPRFPLSKTGLTQCAGNNNVTKRSCPPLKKVATLKMFVNHFKLYISPHKGARAPGKPPALLWSTSIFSTQRWQSQNPDSDPCNQKSWSCPRW